jgi:hypothetical protein
MIYVQVEYNKEHENLFKFGCEGYGWCDEEDLNKGYVNLQCDDNYNGARGYTVKRKYVKLAEVQKENLYRN